MSEVDLESKTSTYLIRYKPSRRPDSRTTLVSGKLSLASLVILVLLISPAGLSFLFFIVSLSPHRLIARLCTSCIWLTQDISGVDGCYMLPLEELFAAQTDPHNLTHGATITGSTF